MNKVPKLVQRIDELKAALAKLPVRIAAQGSIHKIEDFDSEFNWLIRCVADAADKA